MSTEPIPEKEEGMEQSETVNGTPELQTTPVETIPGTTEKPGTSRIRRFVRNSLLILGSILVVFLAGFLTDHFTRYSPTRTALDQAQQSVSDLQSQVDDLTARLEMESGRVAVLEPELESAEQHIELLNTLVELKTAQFELKSDNLAGAKVALSGTAARLEALQPLVESVDATLAGNMLTRLDLILNGMDNKPESSLVDLEMLFGNLQSVETLLFGE